MNPLLLSLILFLTITITPTKATPTVGVTLDPKTPNLPPLSSIVTSLVRHDIPTVRLINPTPSSIHFFTAKNITLLISIPNTFLYSFATNQSSSATWITHNILPFHNTNLISLISIDTTTQLTRFHLPALRNLYTNLRELGIVNIPLSVTFPFAIVRSWFTTSQTELISDLVRFLNGTDSPFLVALFPYKVNLSSYDETSFELALFATMPYNLYETEVYLKGMMDQMWAGIMEKNLTLKYDPGFKAGGMLMGFYKLLLCVGLCALISIFACSMMCVGVAEWLKSKKMT